ncbi:MAG TPA: ABC transporter permease, partial [Terracidiphilus sp.]|nr:ABC transporter permease [Terracidiphilus sp.]
MRWMHKLPMQCKMLFRRDRAGEQLHDELDFHLDQQITENVAAGMSPAEARSAALRSFGNPATLRDQARDTWSWHWLELLLSDMRYSIRTLVRTPGFSVLAIVVMGLGIGANVALFTVVRSVLLRPLPFKDQDRLVRLYEANAKGAFQDNIVAGGTFASWQAQAHSFEGMAIKKRISYNLSGSAGQLPELADAEQASWNLFPLLGVDAAVGRLFLPSDDRPQANPTVILSWGLWKRRYGGDPGLVGKTILLDARPFTVIGILPAWFNYPDSKVQLWTAIYHERSPAVMALHVAHNLDAIARLKPGVTIDQATAELDTIQRQIRHQFPDGPVNDAANIRPILDGEVFQLKTGLYAMFAATGCLLLIACLNIANLLVARAATRRKETAVRTALGGSRARLIRGQVIESVVLSIAGGAVGLALAEAALVWLIHVRQDIPRADSIHIDSMVVLFTMGVMLVCGLIAGLIPALSSNDKQILRTLHESSRSYSGARGGVRLRRVLLGLQVGLTVVLLTSSGLLLKTYARLRSVDIGCATHDVLTMEINLPKGSYKTPAQIVNFYQQLADRVRQLPGVQAAAVGTTLPGEGRQRDDVFTIREHPALPRGQVLDAATYFVDPAYFTALKIPLLDGRVFAADDRLERSSEVIVNQDFVRQFLKGENPLGKHIKVDMVDVAGASTGLEIVGVVADTLEDVSSSPRPAIYYPFYAGSERSGTLVVRAQQASLSMALPVQQAIAAIDPGIAVANLLTMDQIIGQSTIDASFDATLLLAFAVISLVLAAVGLFGVLSYIVAQRTAEIGIRMALGAQRPQVMRLMLRDGLRPAIFGLVLGLVASTGAAQLIQSILYGTPALDPAVY